jgi:endoglucanase
MNVVQLLLNRREFVAGIAAGAAGVCGWQFSREATSNERPTRHRGGVSLAGAEFGSHRPEFSNRNPGIHERDYIYPGERTIAYFAQRGLGLLRLPFRWERLQPEPGESLDAAELQRLRQVLHLAAEHNAQVILDVHNYARYQMVVAGQPRSVVIDELIGGERPVPRSALADLWRRLAAEFADHRAVAGFGLMNEPHDLGNSDWKIISQDTVSAIRSVDKNVTIFVAGDGWSNAHRFEEVNGPRAWIDDPAGRTVYEAHCYFDDDATGQYRRSHAAELADDPQLHDRGANRLSPFVDWCQRNQVPGFLGEFGIPGHDTGWHTVLSRTLAALRRAEMPGCYWAAGEWWHDYPLSLQPSKDFAQPAPHLELVREHFSESVKLKAESGAQI